MRNDPPPGRCAVGGPREEQVFRGLAVGPGVVIGVVHFHDPGDVRAPEYRIAANRITAEKKRFAQAVAAAQRQLGVLRGKAEKLPAHAGEELGFMLDAYGHMLQGSRLVRGVEQRIESDRINAEAAVRTVIADLAEAFASMNDAYLAGRADDIREVGQRLIRNLTKTTIKAFDNLPRRAVVISRDLTPADTAMFDPQYVHGFATESGGAQSHTAIMARSLDLPAVLAVPDLTRAVRGGETVIIDGIDGRVIVNPCADTLAAYRIKRADYLRARRALTRLKDLPAVTTDGVAVRLMANIELPTEADAVLQAGAEGIGLLRSEFLFMNRPDWPTEDEQYAVLRTVIERMQGRQVTVRVLDAGGDKLTSASGTSLPDNPALGLRAVRFLLSAPQVLEAQLAAILRAAVHGPVRILVPMVANCDEIRAVRSAAETVHARLKAKGVPVPDSLPPIGIMIEIPGAALAADALALVSDFFAIGTNDLTQYTLAIDRTDETVAHLYNPLHPAVLRLIHFTTGAALRAGIPISVCGEIAGDPRFAPLLLGMGIRELSMAAGSLPRVKQRIRKISHMETEAFARRVMAEFDPTRIAALVEEFS